MNQTRDADDTQKTVTARSLRIAEEQKECKKLEEHARADLATVEPALNEAMKVPSSTLILIAPDNIVSGNFLFVVCLESSGHLAEFSMKQGKSLANRCAPLLFASNFPRPVGSFNFAFYTRRSKKHPGKVRLHVL